MLKRESLYLDLIRALSAVIVVIDHTPWVFSLPSAPRWGHQAVMVFYVLSGYVIAAAADRPGSSAVYFITARLARLWSVLVPALVLTIVCDFAGRRFGINAGAYEGVPMDLPLIRMVAPLLFLSETWVSIQPMSDGVIWSLCAEFWYYMLFAAWTFLPAGRWRWGVLCILMLLSGFKGILLLPIWLMGVALYHNRAIRRLPDAANYALFGISTVLIGAILSTQFYNVPIAAMQAVTGAWIFRQLAQVRVFWFDWLFGLLVFAHLLGARAVTRHVAIDRIAAPIAWCAGISFAAYLFHAPLLHLLAAFVPGLNGWLAVAITLAIIAAVGHSVEASKGWWNYQLRTLAQRVTVVRH